MWDDELTPEEQNAQYLQQNPHIESRLWSEWVGVVCGWDKIPRPSPDEWAKLRADFYPGKTPNASIADLKKMRLKNEQTN